MERVNIAVLKNRLSAYLQKVRSGETVLVLDRNRPIARIERVAGLPGGANERLARLEAAGIVRTARAPVPLDLLATEPPRTRKSVLDALIAERAEER